jgi:hypothetical protein
MKLLFLYLSGLALAWLSLNAILVALAYWGRDGALMPLLLGLLGLGLAARLLLSAVRRYIHPRDRDGEIIVRTRP